MFVYLFFVFAVQIEKKNTQATLFVVFTLKNNSKKLQIEITFLKNIYSKVEYIKILR